MVRTKVMRIFIHELRMMLAAIVFTQFIVACWLIWSAPAWGCSFISDPTKIVTWPTDPRPALNTLYIDPAYGGCLQRITTFGGDHTSLPVNIYSQLKAWNKNNTRILLQNNQVLDASTYAVVAQMPYMNTPRWDPQNANKIIAWQNQQLRLYDITTQTYTVMHDFSAIYNDTLGGSTHDNNFEEIEENGRFIMTYSYRRSDGQPEIGIYDRQQDKLIATRSGNSAGGCGEPDWLGMSPKGDYAMVNWGTVHSGTGFQDNGGPDCGLVAYDLSFNKVGTTAVGHGHGDLAIAPDGTEYYVVYSPDVNPNLSNGQGSDDHIYRYRVPNGYDTRSSGGMIQLLDPLNYQNMHISCRGYRQNWCVFSVYGELGNPGNPAPNTQPYQREIVRLYLDSTVSVPHIERMFTHRSDFDYINGPACPGWGGDAYWAQAFPSVKNDGTQLIFPSTWDQACRIEAYVSLLSGSDTTPPAAPTGLRVQ